MGCRRDSRNALDVLFVVFFFFVVVVVVFVVILVELVSVFRLLVLFLLIVIVRDGINLDRMNLNDLHLGFTLGTGQDFAFFHFIFVDVNFGSAFGTADHGENLLENG
jgi:hypothetical protein